MEGSNGILLEQSLRFGFKTSKNQPQYKVLIVGLRLASVQRLLIKGGSRLFVNQVKGVYKVKDAHLSEYLEIKKKLIRVIKDVTIEYVL